MPQVTGTVYDHLVIGAGSAGCAVAAQLSRDPRKQVLLIEAGDDDQDAIFRAPFAHPEQFGSSADWGFISCPEPACDQRQLYLPRGKVLGGTSAMNGMVWVRGAAQDYDGWELPGWAWDDVLPTFLRLENHHTGDDNHGAGGSVRVTVPDVGDPLAQRFVDAAVSLGVPRRSDVSGPDLDGAAHSPRTVFGGERWSAARAYLDPASERPNLTVQTCSMVTQIVMEGARAIGIRFIIDGRETLAYSRQDIVVSAGAYGTPHLLQVSGIGPAEVLRDLGINPVIDSPQVGANLMDHPVTVMNWELTEGEMGLFGGREARFRDEWAQHRTGPMTSNVMEAVAHIRTEPGLAAPDFQIICAPEFLPSGAHMSHDRPAFSIMQSHWTPRARGTVMATSGDVSDPPEIRLNLLADQRDMDAMVRAIRFTRRLVQTPPLADVTGSELNPSQAAQSDAQIESWVRATISTTWHPSGTVAMGTRPDSALDPELRVRGAENLRVADTSVFPKIPHANTNAPATLVGERCAQLIQAERSPLMA